MNNTVGNGAGYVTSLAFPGSGGGRLQALGPHPEMQIPLNVYPKMMKLQSGKDDLASFLATGPNLDAAKSPGKLTGAQATVQANFLRALKAWSL